MGVDADVLNAIEKVHTADNDCLHAMIDGANPAPICERQCPRFLNQQILPNAIAGCYIMV